MGRHDIAREGIRKRIGDSGSGHALRCGRTVRCARSAAFARRRRLAYTLLGGLIYSGLTWGQPADELPARSLAATCAACHGTEGRAVRGAAMPPLAGLPRDYFLEQMRAFRSGTRPATIMQQIAEGFDDSQLEALAAYFASRP